MKPKTENGKLAEKRDLLGRRYLFSRKCHKCHGTADTVGAKLGFCRGPG